jgi:diguanylate cyclase (GGDEF)-like protein
VTALLAAAALVTLLLMWSSSRVDSVSITRQEQLVSHILDNNVAKLINEQQSVTLKDNWVRLLQKPVVAREDIARVNGNIGPFLHKYHGHDESYLLAVDDRPIYAMRDGERVRPEVFESVRQAAQPLVNELRAKTRLLAGAPLPDGSPGAHDITIVNGHPAILSLKPVISPSGEVRQTPGREPIQISVLRLDGDFLQRMQKDYLFQGARFSWSGERGSEESVRPFVSSRTNTVIGYFVWRPYGPGSMVMKDMIPPLVLTLLLVAGITLLLIVRIKRSTAKLQASEAQARHLAFHDVLTGLPNRALFEDRLDRALAAGRRQPDQKVALLYLDVDRFKKVNDTLGHPAGDELIRELSRRLSRVVRESDTVARLGGDEFAIIQTGVSSKRDSQLLCTRILASVEGAFDIVGSQVHVGLSIGVARAAVDGHDRTELARKADIALYHAKNEGRGRYAIFTELMDESVQIRQGLEQDLRVALRQGDQLQVYYQPLYDAESKAIAGTEALVRWDHPKQGLLCPAAFIPIAEESGLIEPLGEWVLRTACAAAASWPDQSLAVNVSVVQLRNPAFGWQVLSILRTAGLQPSRLELEITETAFLESFEQCEVNLKVLRAAGVRIALDDFGTGYSSFSLLRDYQVDRLKIDRSFTSGIDIASAGSAIIQAIINLARSSGLKVTAEGVETAEQSRFLSAAGCDELQGYLMSRPITLGEMDAMLGVDPAVRRAAQPLAA